MSNVIVYFVDILIVQDYITIISCLTVIQIK